MTLEKSDPPATKKRQANLKRKKKRAAAEKEEERPSAKPDNALFYLRNWSKRQETEWKFKKAIQVYLLKNGLTMQMSEDDFSIFCDYMNGLSDNAKAALNLKAQQIVDDEKNNGIEIQDRARLLIQSLIVSEKQAISPESSDDSD